MSHCGGDADVSSKLFHAFVADCERCGSSESTIAKQKLCKIYVQVIPCRFGSISLKDKSIALHFAMKLDPTMRLEGSNKQWEVVIEGIKARKQKFVYQLVGNMILLMPKEKFPLDFLSRFGQLDKDMQEWFSRSYSLLQKVPVDL